MLVKYKLFSTPCKRDAPFRRTSLGSIHRRLPLRPASDGGRSSVQPSRPIHPSPRVVAAASPPRPRPSFCLTPGALSLAHPAPHHLRNLRREIRSRPPPPRRRGPHTAPTTPGAVPLPGAPPPLRFLRRESQGRPPPPRRIWRMPGFPQSGLPKEQMRCEGIQYL